jgi:hypothetical protein
MRVDGLGVDQGTQGAYFKSASVPKLLQLAGKTYLYYSLVHVRKNDNQWHPHITTRGIELLRVNGLFWETHATRPVPADSADSVEVMVPSP